LPFVLVRFACVCMGVASPLAWAQQKPTAGTELQQIAPAPAAPARAPELRMPADAPPASASADARKVLVKKLTVAGATVWTADELVRASGFVPGGQYTVSALHALAAKITALYRSRGYFLAQTYLGAQDITDGTVQLTVVEGRIASVNLQNASQVSDGVAHALADPLRTDTAPAQLAPMERNLLLLTDLPGVQVKSVLKPGATPGTTELWLDLAPGPRVSGSVEADNQGNTYTGSNRVGASVAFNEPTGHGDVATARVLTSGEGLAYGRVSYQTRVGSVNAGLAYTTMHYQLGGDLANTQSSGDANVGSVYLLYPLLRSRAYNLAFQADVESKDYSDRVGTGSPANNSDKNDATGELSLKGNYQDASGSTFGNYVLGWAHGNLTLQGADAQQVDANSASTQGAWDKFTFTVARQSPLLQDTDLYFSVGGQWASKNLDASEKFSLGGANGVRAFPTGEAPGDDGILATLESRTPLPGLSESLSGRVQLVTFVDAGQVVVNQNPWSSSNGANIQTLKGAGLGLNYVNSSNLLVRAALAFKLGDEVATSAPDANERFWLQLSKAF